MKSKVRSVTVEVNGYTWDSNQRRRDIACTGCSESTKGRLKKEPWCLECAMKTIVQEIKGLFASLGVSR
jgi:hypothetical protein